MTRYTVFVESDGLHATKVGAFDTEADALQHIAALGGEMRAPLSIPTDNGDDVIAYNIGADDNCPIAWIKRD